MHMQLLQPGLITVSVITKAYVCVCDGVSLSGQQGSEDYPLCLSLAISLSLSRRGLLYLQGNQGFILI